MYITISCFITTEYSQPFVFVRVLHPSLCATLAVMLSCLCCLLIVLLSEDPQGPPPATPGSRPCRPASERHPLKRVLDVDQDAVPKLEKSKILKLCESQLTHRGASTVTRVTPLMFHNLLLIRAAATLRAEVTIVSMTSMDFRVHC